MTDLVRFSIELIEIFRSSATRPSLSWWNVCCKQACVLNAPQKLTNSLLLDDKLHVYIKIELIYTPMHTYITCILIHTVNIVQSVSSVCFICIEFDFQCNTQIKQITHSAIIAFYVGWVCASVSLCVCWNTVVRCVHNKVLKRHHQIIFNLNYICK